MMSPNKAVVSVRLRTLCRRPLVIPNTWDGTCKLMNDPVDQRTCVRIREDGILMMTIICRVDGREDISEASGALVNFNGRGQPTAEYVSCIYGCLSTLVWMMR